jgi:phospholipid/cholesterol/gamma-HCH transport system substrate-binding protein
MDSQVLKFRVGVTVLAAVVLLVVLAALFGDASFWRPTYEIHVRLPDATGVQRGTPVRKSGLLIGRVSELKLADDGVLVTLKIDQHVKLRRNDTCTLRSSLFGDAELAFVPQQDTPGP